MYFETETARCVSMDRKNTLYKNIIIGTFDEIKNSVDLVSYWWRWNLLGLADNLPSLKPMLSELIKDV